MIPFASLLNPISKDRPALAFHVKSMRAAQSIKLDGRAPNGEFLDPAHPSWIGETKRGHGARPHQSLGGTGGRHFCLPFHLGQESSVSKTYWSTQLSHSPSYAFARSAWKEIMMDSCSQAVGLHSHSVRVVHQFGRCKQEYDHLFSLDRI